MIIQPIDVVVLAWLALAILSAAYVAWDQFRGNPEPSVMKWGFVLVTLYMGPIGLLLYVLADKEPRPGTHERFVKPLWKQGVGSTVHCVAGDATGIILAAVCVALIGMPMWQDLIIEYVAGFLFGLLIFQALFMRTMMGGSYWQNVRSSFIPELLSMNLMMAGMAPTMSFLMMGRDMRAMWPGEPMFWFVMSIGVTVGFFVAYPVNVWLVSRGLKHGLMTVGDTGDAHDDQHAHSSHPARHGHEAEQSSAHDDHAMGHGDPAHAVTRAQLRAMVGATTLALLAGMYVPSVFVNLNLSAHDVGGIIMPPGMVMTSDTPAEAMRDMAAVDPRDYAFHAANDENGARELEPRMDGDTKVFRLEISLGEWHILEDQPMGAYAVNGQVPGPTIKLTEGDRVRFEVRNRLPESTTIHWHGLIVPNDMDGPAHITRHPIEPGGSFDYEFQVEQHGTYFYHSHDHADRQQGLGLYGALLVEPDEPDIVADHDRSLQLQEWLERDGLTYPAMQMEGGLPNFFTINGKSYPETATLRMQVGETVRLRFIGSHNNFVHPMHVHGGPFEVVAKDGETLPRQARYLADTVNVAPGERYDVIWTARKPGTWLVHCHIPHHTTNDNVEVEGAGGLTQLIVVT